MLERTLESPVDCKEIRPLNPKGNQPCIFIGRSDAEAETPILWPADGRADSLEKTLMLGRMKGQRRRGGRGRDGWMASPTQWPRISVNSGRQQRTEKPSMLQSAGSQRVEHDNSIKLKITPVFPDWEGDYTANS